MFLKKKKLKEKEGKDLLRHAGRVYDYRRDVLKQWELKELEEAVEDFEGKRGVGVDEKEYEKSFERLDHVIGKYGGDIYPVRFFPENVELLLVAAILAIGIRTFFLQTFVIPTNSMYPTYYGMTADVYGEEADKPGVLKQIVRAAVLGSENFGVSSPGEGELVIPLDPNNPEYIRSEQVKGRKWFGLLPDMKRRYTFLVGREMVYVDMPIEYIGMEDIIKRAYFPEKKDFMEAVVEGVKDERVERTTVGPVLKTGKEFKPGERVLDYDILKGDMLFVDRVTYNFRSPKVGEPIVDRTENIPGLMGRPEKYIIKRLVGKGGDELEVRAPILYRNGEAIEGAEAFKKNFEQEGLYPGYTEVGELSAGRTVKIPEGHFYGMGDNSPHSGDSRYFGSVPERDLVGKALFFFYPFTKRWGLAE